MAKKINAGFAAFLAAHKKGATASATAKPVEPHASSIKVKPSIGKKK